MDKKNILKLSLYGACVLAFITFVLGVASLFDVMSTRGFDLTEYWALIVFGVGVSLIAAVYSLIKGTVVTVKILKERRRRNGELKSPVNHALSADSESETNESQAQTVDENSVQAAEEGNAQTAEDNVQQAADTQDEVITKPKKKRRLTFAERRRQRLLKEDAPKRKNGITGYVLIAVITVGCIYYTFWSAVPHNLCYHTYTYNQAENESLPEQGEIRTYRFYQDYLGKPYFVYLDKEREFRVSLVSSERGSDEVGKYILYHFATEEEYAKVLDCALDKFTYLTVELDAYYYLDDAHLVINHRAVRERTGVETVYEYSGKVYSYKNLNN